MPATINVHDVGHGACVTIESSEGHLAMIDCGHSSEPVWYPSIAYHNKTINLLVVSNLDEDHISDLPGILAGGSQHGNLLSPSPAVKSIAYNQSVSPADLAAMKAADGMDEGVKRFHQ